MKKKSFIPIEKRPVVRGTSFQHNSIESKASARNIIKKHLATGNTETKLLIEKLYPGLKIQLQGNANV